MQPGEGSLDHGCVAKTWATAPPLKTVVLIGSMMSGARKIRSPAPRTAGRMDEKAVLVDQAGPDQRSGEPCPAVDEQVVSTATTGFLTRNNDRHPGSRLSCPVYPDRACGRGLLAAQPDAYSRSRGRAE